jgi:hypothetical protein
MKSKSSNRALFLSFLALILGSSLAHAQSIYYYTPSNSSIESFLSPTGGAGNATFTLSSGPAVPSLGSSFDVPLTFADSTPSGAWDALGLGPGGNGLAFAGSFSMSVADAVGDFTFGSFTEPAGYTTTWSYFTFVITSLNPPQTEDTLQYIGSDTSIGLNTFTGTPDSFRYTEGSNLQSALTSTYQITFTPIPEPSGIMLIGVTVALGLLQRRRA